MKTSNKVALSLLTSLALSAPAAIAQTWPSKPITIVVSYPPGGDTDVVARAYAEQLSARLGQAVIIENRPGASGTIGNASVAKALPDGYTLLFTPSTFPIAQHVLKVSPSVAHDVIKDFTPIIKTGNIPLLAVTGAASGYKDMKQVLAAAKSGKALSYGSPGAGSPMHILGEMLNKEAGIKMNHVPYRGVAPVVADALGGHVAVGWVTPGAVASHLETGKLIPLVTGEQRRTKSLPKTPTLIEMGYKSLDVSAWMGLLGPKGMPADVVNKLNQHMNEILNMTPIKARMSVLGIDPIGGTPAVLAKQISDDEQRFGRLVKEFGIKAE
jgi:tripartite-type tricarboxylate transporter receptor subunit TctC